LDTIFTMRTRLVGEMLPKCYLESEIKKAYNAIAGKGFECKRNNCFLSLNVFFMF